MSSAPMTATEAEDLAKALEEIIAKHGGTMCSGSSDVPSAIMCFGHVAAKQKSMDLPKVQRFVHCRLRKRPEPCYEHVCGAEP